MNVPKIPGWLWPELLDGLLNSQDAAAQPPPDSFAKCSTAETRKHPSTHAAFIE
jgi:hypothetical protein